VPGEVIEYAARLLPHIAPGLEPPTSVRRTRGELAVAQVPSLDAPLADLVRATVEEPGSVGVIAPDADVDRLAAALAEAGIPSGGADDDERVSVLPATVAKGLEYDHVVVVEPADIVAAEERGLNRLYVVLTRAVSRLAIVHVKPLPSVLVT